MVGTEASLLGWGDIYQGVLAATVAVKCIVMEKECITMLLKMDAIAYINKLEDILLISLWDGGGVYFQNRLAKFDDLVNANSTTIFAVG